MPFRLRDMRVEPDSGSIVGPAGHVHLEPRVMAVLVMLASQANELVTRQTLLESIWTGGEVYDEALTQCIYQLRQQLISAGGASHQIAKVVLACGAVCVGCDWRLSVGAGCHLGRA